MMAACTTQGTQLLNGVKRLTKFDRGLGLNLPESYRKFWIEWKQTKPAAVHCIPTKGKWVRQHVTGAVRPIQNIAIPIIYPPEHHDGMWGGEGIVKGFQKRDPLKRRVPHFWAPVLRRSVVKSEVLNEFISVTLTDRTLNLIHESNGFDHYLLKTPACDLKSILALKIKRQILQRLEAKCHSLVMDNTKHSLVLKEYGKYMNKYTSDEIDWYGLTFGEAILKMKRQTEAAIHVVPHKMQFRKQLLKHLKEVHLNEKSKDDFNDELNYQIKKPTSWLAKISSMTKK